MPQERYRGRVKPKQTTKQHLTNVRLMKELLEGQLRAFHSFVSLLVRYSRIILMGTDVVFMSAKKKHTTDGARTAHTDEQQALTEAELKEVHQNVRPGVGKMVGVSLLMGALGGGALAGGVGMLRSARILRLLIL